MSRSVTVTGLAVALVALVLSLPSAVHASDRGGEITLLFTGDVLPHTPVVNAGVVSTIASLEEASIAHTGTSIGPGEANGSSIEWTAD